MKQLGLLLTIPLALFPAACGSSPDPSTSAGTGTTGATTSGTGGATSTTSSGSGGAGGATSATSSGTGGTGGSTSATSSGTGGVAPCDPANTATDPHNCGACGHDCLGGLCKASVCKPFAIVTGPVDDFCADDTNVYWRNGDDKTIQRTPLAGGAPTKLLGGIGNIISVNVIGANLFVGGQDAIYEVPTAGGVSTQLTTGVSTPGFFKLDGGSIYFSNITGGTVMKMALPGGMLKTIASGQLIPVENFIDATSLYWVTVGNPGQSNGTVMSTPLPGGSLPTTLVSGEESACGLAGDGQNLYWSNIGGTTLKKVPIGGGAPTTLVAGTALQFEGCGVAVDATDVYWTTSRIGPIGSKTGQLHRMPLAGGAPTTLLSGLASPVGLIVDGVSIFWLNESPVVGEPHQIMRLAK